MTRQKSGVTIDTSLFVNAVGAVLLAMTSAAAVTLWSINRDVGALYAAAEIVAEQNASFVTALSEISENNAEEAIVLTRLAMQMEFLEKRMTDLEILPASGPMQTPNPNVRGNDEVHTNTDSR